jgi:hypothetical protein
VRFLPAPGVGLVGALPLRHKNYKY